MDKKMNRKRELTLLKERDIGRMCWEAPGTSDTSTREPCWAEKNGRSASTHEKERQVVDSDTQA